MRVTVRLFAGLRERAGRSSLELEDVARIEDIWPALGLGGAMSNAARSSPTVTRSR
jgi:hypothetical protein